MKSIIAILLFSSVSAFAYGDGYIPFDSISDTYITHNGKKVDITIEYSMDSPTMNRDLAHEYLVKDAIQRALFDLDDAGLHSEVQKVTFREKVITYLVEVGITTSKPIRFKKIDFHSC